MCWLFCDNIYKALETYQIYLINGWVAIIIEGATEKVNKSFLASEQTSTNSFNCLELASDLE
jgi:hypothetical protein